VTHSKNAREKWWLYERSRPQLYRTIADLDRVLVVARVSKTALPVFVPTGQVVSEMVVVFTSNDFADLALLDSGIHYIWAIARGSSLKGDLRYTPSDVYETLSRPAATASTKKAGMVLDEARCGVMADRQIGLTKLYNMIHDSSIEDQDIKALRDAHVSVDEAVSEAYDWSDLNLRHGFYNTERGPRFTFESFVRIEILDRLLALNHLQYGQINAHEASIEKLTARAATGASDSPPPAREGMLF
jgi:hypothetical protein